MQFFEKIDKEVVRFENLGLRPAKINATMNAAPDDFASAKIGETST